MRLMQWMGSLLMGIGALVALRSDAFATHPVCIEESDNYTVEVGQTLTFNIAVDDVAGPTYDQSVKLVLDGAYSIPSGMSTSPALGTFFDPPSYGSHTFTWTPTAGQEGTYTLLFHAIDSAGNVDGGVNQVPPCELTITVTAPPPTTGACPLTQGYWKNHTSAWKVTSLQLGSQTYSASELLAILQKPVRRDASLNLAHQLIATLLNYANGADQSVASVNAAIADAQSLLSGYSGKLPYGVKSSSTTGARMVADAGVLDDYNNGRLTDCK